MWMWSWVQWQLSVCSCSLETLSYMWMGRFRSASVFLTAVDSRAQTAFLHGSSTALLVREIHDQEWYNFNAWDSEVIFMTLLNTCCSEKGKCSVSRRLLWRLLLCQTAAPALFRQRHYLGYISQSFIGVFLCVMQVDGWERDWGQWSQLEENSCGHSQLLTLVTGSLHLCPPPEASDHSAVTFHFTKG